MVVLGILMYDNVSCGNSRSKVMDIRWIKGYRNNADAFTKNLDGPALEKCIRTLVGQDVHMKSYPFEQGGCQEGS